ncbi:peptidoglycan/xylan/chitin deacetylase (PgdA/CDA1 family) [Mucilaginibacter sp. UYP25]|uniref:polysaccharide deacetylase family protein n=1 Tax=unclassified Mucilaginibacter TaxID=2617802 RepID=UPI0033921DC8
MRFLVCFISLGLSSIGCFAQKANKLDYTIAPWLNNKKAAVTLTFDDGLHGQYYIALPLLMQYGFKSTFFVTVNTVNNQVKNWDVINKAVLAGNEIGNHCITHPHFKNMPLDSIAIESIVSNKLINTSLTSQKVITLAYPFGEGGGNTEKDQQIRQTITKFYIGARATQNKPYAYNKYDFAKTNDDYYKVNSVMIADLGSMNNFGKYIDQTIADGGWFCPTYHGIADGWIITPEATFKKHLAQLEQRKADVWIAPFRNVLQYHKERNSAKLTATSRTSKTWRLALTDTLSNGQNFDQPLTINLNINSRKIRSVSQKGKAINFVADKNKIVFNALPGNDNIVIEF